MEQHHLSSGFPAPAAMMYSSSAFNTGDSDDMQLLNTLLKMGDDMSHYLDFDMETSSSSSTSTSSSSYSSSSGQSHQQQVIATAAPSSGNKRHAEIPKGLIGAAAVLNYPVDRVQESLHSLALGANGGSPVLALKRRHSIRKRAPNKIKKTTTAMAAPEKMIPSAVGHEQHASSTMASGLVELEDLGADYLDELLRVSFTVTAKLLSS